MGFLCTYIVAVLYCPASLKIARQFLHYDRYRVACGLERPLPSIYMHVYTLYMYVHVRPHNMYTFNTQQASYQFWRGPCDACATDHVINSSRPSASVFPPPHLIITRNAHGAEEGEGLGMRLNLCTRVSKGLLSRHMLFCLRWICKAIPCSRLVISN